MTNSDNSSSAPKKSLTRKKMVDLKAVAALLDDSDDQNNQQGESSSQPADVTQISFAPNEDLILATSHIKNQRDLVSTRIKKMDQNQNRVTRNVFEKVYRDYAVQLETINVLLNEKKNLVKKELKNFYLIRERQTIEMNRHKEILEEARFRHYLEEFSEEQYKEVEEFENREISSIQKELAQINSFIRVHEELLDPEDLGTQNKAVETPTQAPVIKEEKVEAKPFPSPVSQATISKPVSPSKPIHDFSEKTPLPEFQKPVESSQVEYISSHNESSQENNEPLIEVGEENNYFNESDADLESNTAVSEPQQMKSQETKISEPSYSTDPKKTSFEETGKISLYKEKDKEPESILDIIKDIPLEGESSETYKIAPQSKSETSESYSGKQQSPAQAVTSAYKLIFTEGENEAGVKEMPLKDNFSIGRSPSNDLVFKAAKVSRQHAAINKYKDQYVLIDLKSSNGVFVGGKKVDEHILQDGDDISIGGYRMTFKKS